MRIVKTIMAIVGLAITGAAHAKGEGLGEFRLSGIANADGAAIMGGLGAGYDFDLSKRIFAGIKATVDGSITDPGEFWIFGGEARLGVKLDDKAKIYVLGGLAGISGFGDKGGFLVGGGGQLNLSRKLFTKIEYRQVLGTNSNDGEGNSGNLNQFTLGLGLRF